MKNGMKQRLTAFVDPILVTRAKVRGALEGLTISEVVEKALDSYAPRIDKSTDKHFSLEFVNDPSVDIMTLKENMINKKVRVHTKHPGVPR